MSLLMDALKKAELAKNQARSAPAEPGDPAELPSLSLEPIDTAPAAAPTVAKPDSKKEVQEVPASPGGMSTRLPELPDNLQGLDEQFIAHHAAHPASRTTVQSRGPTHQPPAAEATTHAAPANKIRQTVAPRAAPATKTPAAGENDRLAARNLFEAKESAAPASRRNFAIGVGIVTLLAILGMGGYFWWQLQPKGSPLQARSAPPAPALPSAQTPQSAAVAAAPQATAVAGEAPAATSASLAPPAPAAKPAVPPEPTFKASASAVPDREADARPARKSARATATAPALPAQRVFQETKKPLQVNPTLARAYDMFNLGDYAAARKEYERVLAAEPQSTDALHGMAAIAVRENRPEAAEHFYQRILVADPKDGVALSGLLNLRGAASQSTESQLKALAAGQPELAAPHVALGNLYSTQNRWNEAQQAYFNAHALEPENPDLLFNLAVSLEHLRKPVLASQYYKQALAAARQRPAGFDPAQAQERLRALQP